MPPNIPAMEAAVELDGGLGEACETDVAPADDLLGVDLPSLLSLPSRDDALARDGGRGDNKDGRSTPSRSSAGATS